MRTSPVPPFQAAPEEPLLCAFEAQPASGAFHREVRAFSPLGRKAVTPRVEYYYRQLKALPRRVRRALSRRYARSLAGVALLLALGQLPALAATIALDGASCTLIEAIKAANTDAASGNCPAGSGADTLVLAPSSTHTLTTIQDTTYGTSGLPLVTSQITIAGNDSTIERDPPAPEFRMFAVATTGSLTLQATTVTGGVALGRGGDTYNHLGDGGGIFNRGSLTLTNSTVSGNSAGSYGGGVASYYSSVTIENSTVSGNTAGAGGGVNSRGTVTLTNSTVSGNTAGYGGGMDSRGTLTLTDSTISGNTADRGGGLSGSVIVTSTNSTISGNTALYGGGVFAFDVTLTNITVLGNSAGYGGGVFSRIFGGNVTLIGSTVSGNSAHTGGGIYSRGARFGDECYAGDVLLVNSTVSGNSASAKGGGIYQYIDSSRDYFECGTVTLSNSTISGNSAHDGGGLYADGGDVILARTLASGNVAPNGRELVGAYRANLTADNSNLFGTNGDAGIVGFTPGPSDVIPVAGVTLADILAPLADNGGPSQTHALVFGSPAIDASPIDKDCELTDQRGVFRPQGPACDIGAFEAGVEPDPFASPTPTTGCTVNGVPDQLCRGTSGPDRIVGTTGNDVILGLEGHDYLNGSSGEDRLFGGEDNDRLIGGNGDDHLFGQTGDDDLRGCVGNDLLEGGDGNDRLKGHEGDDQLRGGNGDDALRGLDGQDTLEGGAGGDLLRGGADSDGLNGGPGADTLNGGRSFDSCTSDAEDKLVVLCE